MYDSPLPRESVTMHFLDDEAVLFDQVDQMIVAVNTSAAAVWCCLVEGMSRDRIVDELVSRFGISADNAEYYVEDTIRQWNLTKVSRSVGQPDSASGMADEIDSHWMSLAPLTAPAATARYRLLDTVFALRFETQDLESRIDPTFRHLSVPDPVPVTSTIDVRTRAGRIGFFERGQLMEECELLESATATAKLVIVEKALGDCTEICALHAGAVRSDADERCILFPGHAGSGKSTLVAGLAAEGFTYLGDDTVVLTDEDLKVRPVPTGICVKKGAWKLLSTRYPEIRDAPRHIRPDGKHVRYVLPPEFEADGPSSPAPVGWIVFPRFQEGAGVELRPMTKAAALERLMTQFVPLRGHLTPDEVERIVRWIDDIPCMELRMSSLSEAVGLISHLAR